MLARILIIAATAAIGGGIALSRKSIDQHIEKKIPSAIETATILTEAELDKQISQVVWERSFAFSMNLLIKAALIGGVYLLFDAGQLTARGLHIVVGLLIFGFIIRDIMKTAPYVAPVFSIVKQHRWNLRRAITEFVAGIAFERAYAKTMLEMETGPNRIWLAISNYSSHSISTEVASAVGDVARKITFDLAKWRVLLALLFTAIMLGVYAAFIFFTIGATS